MWGDEGGSEKERRLAKDALKMDDAPEQRQLGELNIAPLAYASPGTTKEPSGACSSLADTRLGRCECLQLMHDPRKCVGAQAPSITPPTSTCSGERHNQAWTLMRERELPPPRPALGLPWW